MKVIDLLNKIANKDLDTPDYIEYFDRETSKSNKMMVCEENIIYYMNRKALFLNDEVEIIEPQEHKIPEKLEICYSPDIEEEIFYEKGNKPNHYVLGDAGNKLIISKINEILDYLEVSKDE